MKIVRGRSFEAITNKWVLVLLLMACTSPGDGNKASDAGIDTSNAPSAPTPVSTVLEASPEPKKDSIVPLADEVSQSRNTAIVQAAKRVAPAVVSISVIRTGRARAMSMWESFFMPPQRRSTSFGSGVIVRSDGIVLTNDHVIANAEQIRVSLPGGGDFEAELIGTDPLACLLYTSPSPRDGLLSRMPSSA